MSEARTFRIEVGTRPTGDSSTQQQLVEIAHELGVTALESADVTRLFFLRGDLSREQVDQLSAELLADPVTETWTVGNGSTDGADHLIEVTLLPGVTDPVAENLVERAHLLGINGLDGAATGKRYRLTGKLAAEDLQQLAIKVFSNSVIQRVAIDTPISSPLVNFQSVDETVETVTLSTASDDELEAISKRRLLALDLAEMQAIRDYYAQEGREPRDIELEMLAQSWSEHCVHKTFKANIDYFGPPPGTEANAAPQQQQIKSLFNTYIRRATETLAKPWVRSAFVDNAGIIEFNESWDLAFKVETHNHPSALEPFGGANTGVGGVVRDILGVSARPIANTDVLCFGPGDMDPADVPSGVIHPERIAAGVVAGVADYGNKMGIPTVNGAILYHPGYTANPLVFCGCLGSLPRGSHPSSLSLGDHILVIGGRTGRDGLHGATFSSMTMDDETGVSSGGAVQIGHPINEKQVLEVVLQARDEKLYSAITDCGAGGLSSAVGEMAGDGGARVQLQAVPLKYPGLRPWEIWLSEAQERMVLAVPDQHLARMQQLCREHNVEAAPIGTFEATGRLSLFYGERLVGELNMNFLHDGLPVRHLTAVWQPLAQDGVALPEEPQELSPALLALLAHPNIRSKEAVIRQYDHEVQGSTAVKPLVGVAGAGPGDAAVLVPLDTQSVHPGDEPVRGVALGAGICPAYGESDPYAMSWAAVDEALRNVVAVGADPDKASLLDNFCWGDPRLPDRLGSLVRCAQGLYDAAMAYGAPFISGKDSLNNEYNDADGTRRSIPGTLLVSTIAAVPDVERTVTMDLKEAGNLLYIVGDTRAELGGSHYLMLEGSAGGKTPQPVTDAPTRLRAMHHAIRSGLVRACHDLSEGGLGVALAEMCLAGNLGADIDLAQLPGAISRADTALFSESLSRFLVEVAPEQANAFEASMAGVPCAFLGSVTENLAFVIRDAAGAERVHIPVDELAAAWHGQRTVVLPPPALERYTATVATTLQTRKPRVIILHSPGTNRDRDAALACRAAGGEPEIVTVEQVLAGRRNLDDYNMLVLPGGFSYGDDLGAGVLWALDLRYRLGEQMTSFVESGKPVLGICNGFQALVKAGFLPGDAGATQKRRVTLAHNESGLFECRWVYLEPNKNSQSLFIAGLDEPIYCPVAHGEGRLMVADGDTLDALGRENLITLSYAAGEGGPPGYPGNPSGSQNNIAALSNRAGNVLGLMPHPEDHIFAWQHPRQHRGERGLSGLSLFRNGIKNA